MAKKATFTDGIFHATDDNLIQKQRQELLWVEHQWTYNRRIVIGSSETHTMSHKQCHKMEEGQEKWQRTQAY